MAKATQFAIMVAKTVHSKTLFSIIARVFNLIKLFSSKINKLVGPFSCESPIVTNLVLESNWRVCFEVVVESKCWAAEEPVPGPPPDSELIFAKWSSCDWPAGSPSAG